MQSSTSIVLGSRCVAELGRSHLFAACVSGYWHMHSVADVPNVAVCEFVEINYPLWGVHKQHWHIEVEG